MILPVGHIAPDFNLLNQTHQRSRLYDLEGPKAILFFPTAFSFYCGNKIPGVDALGADLKKAGFQHFLAISRESPWASQGFAKALNLEHFTLLSDMDNRVACEWGTYIPSGTQRVNKRAFFLLDEENRVRYSHDITLRPSGFDLAWLLSNLDSILGDPPPEPAPWDGPIPEEEEVPTGEIPAPGEEAPDFEVMESHMNPVALQDFRGSRVVLLFYQHDYSLACSELLLDYASHREEFEKRDTVVLAINRDNPYTHRAFAKEFGFIDSHLLSDMNGAVARRWGLFVGGAERAHKKAVFLLDEEGRVLWREVLKTQESLLPAREVLAKLDELAE